MLKYDLGQEENKNWVISETEFKPNDLRKYESIMALGNGYLGLRSSTEESYVGQVRNLFVAGTFNKFDDLEVTELPNAADLIELKIVINGERFSLEKGLVKDYCRKLNLKTGELTRRFIWINNKEQEFLFHFRRFVSLKNYHLIGMRVEIIPLNCTAEIKICSGINGQMTNSGAQHFHEGDKRIYYKKYIQMLQTTTESKIDFVFNTVHRYEIDGEEIEMNPRMEMDRRKVLVEESVELHKGQSVLFEKLSNVYTSRDKGYANDNYDLQEMKYEALSNLQSEAIKGYEILFQESAQEWDKRWRTMKIQIESQNEFDELAIRFAQYHLITMTPAHDSRFGIAAKGLTGEGYKGHSFWDTEIFILPFYTFTYPEVAKTLLIYRYNTIEGARKKASDNGYEGAMFPWESAFTGEEETPVWGSVDIITGKATKILSGFIEQHITSDITFAVWQYFMATDDQEFMGRYGYEMIFDTAKFWASRLEWDEESKSYHINNVIGPDEYKEHVNNNAYTNYMAHWNIQIAISSYSILKQTCPALWDKLNEKLNLIESFEKWTEKIGEIFLPEPREEDLVIPQDDAYLKKSIIDLSKYKAQKHVGSIFEDYNLDQVNEIQVSKQADVLVLFYLMENNFSQEVKRANWDYYEPKTLHDSSLSLSTHCVLSCDLEHRDLAYELFERASRIDLGPNMKSSNEGIHSASMGGVWQSVVFGFGGVRMLDGKLRINPKLPKKWTRLSYPIYWKGDRIEVIATHNEVKIENTTKSNEEITLEVHGASYSFIDTLTIKF